MNRIHCAWMESDKDARFSFLEAIDHLYGEGKGERGRGLLLIHQSFMGKIKRLEEERFGTVKLNNTRA